MHRSAPAVFIAILFAASALGCATTTPQDDGPPASERGPVATPDGAAAPAEDAAPSAGDADGIGAVTVTVTHPDGRQQTHRWAYAGGGNVNGVVNLAFKPDPTTLVPNVGIMLLRPVAQGLPYDLSAGGDSPTGTATLMLDAQHGYQLATGTLTFSRVAPFSPAAVEVDGVLTGEWFSMMNPADTVVVEVTFRGAIIAG